MSPPFQRKIGRGFPYAVLELRFRRLFIQASLLPRINCVNFFSHFVPISSMAFTIMVNSCSILFSDTCGRAHTLQQLSAFCCICICSPNLSKMTFSCKMCIRNFKCFGEINCNGRIALLVSITQPVT